METEKTQKTNGFKRFRQMLEENKNKAINLSLVIGILGFLLVWVLHGYL